MDVNEQTILKLQAALEREVSEAQTRAQHDITQLNEISRINNELANAQRELAGKDAELLLLNQELDEAHGSVRRDAEILKVSETRYRRLFEAARDGILILDAVTCKIIDVNPFMVELLGYTREEFLGKELFEIGLLKDAAASQAMYAELQKTGYIRYDDLPLETKAGERVAVEFVSNVYPENEHQVIQCNIRDISGRKQAQQELQASEARKSAILETALDCIIGIDAQSRIVEWNPASEKTFGYAREEVIGKLLPEFIIPESSQEAHYAGMAKYLASGEGPLLGRRIEILATRRNGEEFPVELAITRIESDGAPVFIAYLRDITERKHAEEISTQLAAIVEASDDAIISKTLDGIITTWNTGAQKLYGYTAQEAIGRPVSFLAPSHLSDEMPELLEKLWRGEAVEHYETVRVRKDGSRVDISLSISPLKNAEGVLIGASSIKHDITERKRGEAALRASEERFRAFMDNTPTRVFIKDEEGRYVYLNKAVELLTHTPLAELLGKTNYDRLPEETARQLRANDVQVLTNGQAQQFEELVPDRDGNLHHELVVKFPLTGADGEQLLAGMAVDISARKQAEKALQQQAEVLARSNDEMARFNRLAVGRELRMVELKQQINRLSEQLGTPPPYKLAFLAESGLPEYDGADKGSGNNGDN